MLPFDPITMDIVCRRSPAPEWMGGGSPEFNIEQRVVHHSPTGMEWGYGGSGPADFALNIMNLFLPILDLVGGDVVGLYRGTCARDAWDLHQPFKWAFIATLPREGGTIKGDDIRAWIKENTPKDGEPPPLALGPN